MAVQTLHDTGNEYLITPKMDGAVYNSGIKDGICDIGDKFEMQYAADSLTVSFNAGNQAVIGGAFFRITENTTETCTLPANTTSYVCANIDLSKANGSRGAIVARATSEINDGNLNDDGGDNVSRDLLLYVVKTGANGVTSVTDKRVFLDNRRDLDSASSLIIKFNGEESSKKVYSPYNADNLAVNITTGYGIDVTRQLAQVSQLAATVKYPDDDGGAPYNCVALLDYIGHYGGVYLRNAPGATRVLLFGDDTGSYENPHIVPIAKGQVLEITRRLDNDTPTAFRVYRAK